ncbi:MAG TPA: hypothetical protein VJ476_06105 [Rhizomicrobium sp.]|nr:hypothetical protein [Rhizomicrobium sp.]
MEWHLTSEDTFSRARRYRDRADELRMTANSFKDKKVRLAVFRLAESYQSLAASLAPARTIGWIEPFEEPENKH